MFICNIVLLCCSFIVLFCTLHYPPQLCPTLVCSRFIMHDIYMSYLRNLPAVFAFLISAYYFCQVSQIREFYNQIIKIALLN